MPWRRRGISSARVNRASYLVMVAGTQKSSIGSTGTGSIPGGTAPSNWFDHCAFVLFFLPPIGLPLTLFAWLQSRPCAVIAVGLQGPGAAGVREQVGSPLFLFTGTQSRQDFWLTNLIVCGTLVPGGSGLN